MNKNNIKFIKSPMNYPGNKYKLLSQLYPFFPKKINNFIDLFCGGLDVSININATTKYANDLDTHLIDIYKAFQNITFNELIIFIEKRIKEFQLTRYNWHGFEDYKHAYNTTTEYNTPLDLFLISRFSFNNNIGIKNNRYNEGFGFDRSDFNLTQQAHTKFLHSQIQNIIFSSVDFSQFSLNTFTSLDFIYVDPPYLITDNGYNFPWNEEKEYQLYQYLNEANDLGIKWGLSNVIAHKGKYNEILNEWAEQYHIHDIHSNYQHSSFNAKTYSDSDFTLEVFITNY